MTARVHIGTSGWSYRDWVGPFYPDRTAPADYLGVYSKRFEIVEVDSTFYGVPRRETVENWARRTPEGFRFAPKVPGAVTHGSERQSPVPAKVLRDTAALDEFLSVLEPLREKLAPVVFQFPYFRSGTLTLDAFLERLAPVLEGLPDRPRFAVEIRNKAWLTDGYLALLRQHGIGAVMIDHPYMPPPRQQLALGMVTADFSVIRLLGDRYEIEKTTKKWGEVVLDRRERLDEWAEVIDALRGDAALADVYAFSNNHYAGHGPETCRDLRSRLGIPPTEPPAGA